MTYTVSHRQGGVQRSAVEGLIRHTFRDVDKSNGVETQHSNERIVPGRTHLNESMLFVDGQQVDLTDSRQIVEELDRRLSKAGGTRTNKKTGKVSKIAVRKDAAVVRDIVLQLDPTFTRSSAHLLEDDQQDHRDEVRGLLGEMVDHYAEVYGDHNVLAASLHWDETSPHIHLMVTPIDDQGRVRQESFIPAGRGRTSGLSKNDRAMRDRLKGAGYDVDPEPRGANRSNLSIDEYAKWQERIMELEEREVEVEDRQVRLRASEGRVEERREDVYDRDRAVEAREASVSAREAEVALQAAEALKVSQRAAQALEEAREARDIYEEKSRQLDEGLARLREGDRAQRELLAAARRGEVKLDRERFEAGKVKIREAAASFNEWERPRDDGPELGG